jgi:hypothetical protein
MGGGGEAMRSGEAGEAIYSRAEGIAELSRNSLMLPWRWRSYAAPAGSTRVKRRELAEALNAGGDGSGGSDERRRNTVSARAE